MLNRNRDMMKRTLPFSVGMLLASAASSVFAFQPLITDDTGTQGAGGNQIEFSINKDQEKTAGVTTQIRTLPLVYTRGLTDALDIFIGVNHVSASAPGSDVSGSGNPSFGVKWRLYENEESKTSLGLKPEVILPVSSSKESDGLGVGRTSYGLTLILTQEISFGAVHANLFSGRERFRDPAVNPEATITRASIAPVWDVAEGWALALDVGTETEKAGGNATRSRFTEIGAIYSPSKDLDFALGLIRSTDDAQPDTQTNSATLGVTWRFK